MKWFCECERPSGAGAAAINTEIQQRAPHSRQAAQQWLEEVRKSDESRSSLQHPVYCDRVEGIAISVDCNLILFFGGFINTDFNQCRNKQDKPFRDSVVVVHSER